MLESPARAIRSFQRKVRGKSGGDLSRSLRRAGRHLLEALPVPSEKVQIGMESLRQRDLPAAHPCERGRGQIAVERSEEHQSELQSQIRIPYAVFGFTHKMNQDNT